mgnify:CR=1 FL=1
MNKRKWTPKELEEFREMILAKRTNVLDETDELKKRVDEMQQDSTSNALYSSHMADASSDHVEMEKTYYMIAREKKFIQYLDKALLMIQEGNFGICISCEKLIDKERLEEVPHTTKCFDCKTSR